MNGVSLLVIYIISILFLVFIDQITKIMVVLNVKRNIEVIKDVLYITYAKNTGAAFSILQNKILLFIIITIIFCLIMLYFLFSISKNRSQRIEALTISLIIAGAIGNLIDRIRLRYVVDFIYFKPINWPVFNLADSFIVVGCLLYIIAIIRESLKNK